MTATLYKNDKPIKTYSDITRVEANEKYGYFEFYQKIYHHLIIFVRSFKDVDKVVTKDKDDHGTVITKEIRPYATH